MLNKYIAEHNSNTVPTSADKAINQAARNSQARVAILTALMQAASAKNFVNIVRDLLDGAQKEIAAIVKEVLASKQKDDADADANVTSEVSYFDAKANLRADRIEALIGDLQRKLQSSADKLKDKDKQYAEEMARFVEKNKPEIVQGLSDTILSLARMSYTDTINGGILVKMAEIEDKKTLTSSLEEAAKDAQSSNPSNIPLPTAADARILSAQQRRDRMQRTVMQKQEEYERLMHEHDTAQEQCLELQDEIQQLESELSGLQERRTEELAKGKNAESAAKMTAKSAANRGGSADRQRMENELNQKLRQAWALLDDPVLKKFIEPSALQRVRDRHLNLTDEKMKINIRQQGYGYEAVFEPAELPSIIAAIEKERRERAGGEMNMPLEKHTTGSFSIEP